VWVAAVVGAIAIIFGVLGALNRFGRQISPGLVQGSVITFVANDNIFRVAPAPDAQPNNLSRQLDAVGNREGEESALNVSPNGDWLVFTTTRGDEDCAGWSCLAIAANQTNLQAPEMVYLEGWEVIHPEGSIAINSAGDTIVYVAEGEHELDIWAIEREEDFWSQPWSLTDGSTFEWNEAPAFDQDGEFIVFSCGDDQYAEVGGHICEVSLDGNDFEVLIGPEDGPTQYAEGENTLSNPDYTADGVIFTATWNNSSIWILQEDEELPKPFPAQGRSILSNHFLGCTLADGSVVTLAWDEAVQGPRLVVTRPDGINSFTIQTPGAVDYGLVGCGR
jgi:Tol biopolymer transport system component